MSDSGKNDPVVRTERSAVIAIRLSRGLATAIDEWAQAHHVSRSDAIRRLLELGLKAASATDAHHSVHQHSNEIENEAISLIDRLLDPSLPAEERERRIRRLVAGPPEFARERRDLPKHEK